jgi:hypothetical protein
MSQYLGYLNPFSSFYMEKQAYDIMPNARLLKRFKNTYFQKKFIFKPEHYISAVLILFK